jgi:hypothetical protein
MSDSQRRKLRELIEYPWCRRPLAVIAWTTLDYRGYVRHSDAAKHVKV